MNMPSQQVELNNDIVHFFVDNKSMEEYETHNETSDEDTNTFRSVV